MANNNKNKKKNKHNEQQKQYQKIVNEMKPRTPIAWNAIKAFVIGGLICVLGQLIQMFYISVFDFDQKSAGNPTVATLIFLSALLTGLGVYDKFGQFAGAGSAVPVTGFANSITSAAMEHRQEGLVLGIGGNMFKLAGSVIVFGVVAAFVIGLIHAIINVL